MHKAKIASFQCFANLGRLSEAVSSLQELQGVHDNIYGRQHKYYGRTLLALARAQHLSGNARAARCLYDKVLLFFLASALESYVGFSLKTGSPADVSTAWPSAS